MTRTNRARHRRETGGRALASVLTALSLMLAGLVGLAGPAAADEENLNNASSWQEEGWTCKKIEGEPLKTEQLKYQSEGDLKEGELVKYVLPEPPTGQVWSLLVIKASNDRVIYGDNEAAPSAGNSYASVAKADDTGFHGISHVIRCYEPDSAPTPVPVVTSVSAQCVAEDASVSVVVDADSATGLVVRLVQGGSTVASQSVPADGAVSFSDVAAGEYTVELVDGNTVVDTDTVTVQDCDVPEPNPNAITNAAAAADICVDDGVRVDLSNEGSAVNAGISFVVSVNGVTKSVEVPAKAKKTEIFAAEEDKPVSIVVSAGDKEVYEFSGMRNCIAVAPGEDGGQPAEDDAPVSPEEEQSAEEEQAVEQEQTVEQEQSETAVLGTKIPAVQSGASVPGEQLPRTGPEQTGLLALALGLITAGAAGIIGSSLIGRRRRA
ncbi:LPXTG cell wall anchor domain-containing protein [Kineosporiaceae bacterium SCSIO 59966]|nr:LPXTG cell wall anchor domain-containing protein [Kineosporiaceae bacterium SCSIO 59966]